MLRVLKDATYSNDDDDDHHHPPPPPHHGYIMRSLIWRGWGPGSRTSPSHSSAQSAAVGGRSYSLLTPEGSGPNPPPARPPPGALRTRGRTTSHTWVIMRMANGSMYWVTYKLNMAYYTLVTMCEDSYSSCVWQPFRGLMRRIIRHINVNITLYS